MRQSSALMRVEPAASSNEGGSAEIITTGARFRFLADGRIEADQRLPAPRACFVATLDVPPAPWRIESIDADRAVLRRDDVTAEVRDDSTVTLTAARHTDIRTEPSFAPDFSHWSDGRMIALDGRGGYGAYAADFVFDSSLGRVSARLPPTPGHVEWGFDDASPIRLAVFPPRPPDPRLLDWNIAHEGTPGAPFPSDDTIADAARTCRVLALHAYIWRAAPWRLRVRPGRYFLRSNSWRSALHEPADSDALARTMATARRHGMKVVLYLSPRYSTAPDLFAEIARVLDTHAPDGLYLDGITALHGHAGLTQMEHVLRRTRALLGDDRLLYLHPGDEPYGTPLLPCPFLDAHADFVLRGSEGTGGRPLGTFLRHAVSGWNVSGSVGVWCHYGSQGTALSRLVPFERPPRADDIDVATRNHVRLWRRSRWGAAALRDFDARYGPAFAAMVRDERASSREPGDR
ncbi:MAG: hypothetical protein K8T90_18305 [Planctomycetes bacterium]|nr:hypothetical protein [Planctomycetota bacterium]